jgi:tetratricopeptide (TPR) repeat protein
MTEQERSPLRAEKLTREAADLIGVDDDKAERLLRDALAADLYHGPAHNNLGVIFLNRGMLYEAAGEFEWARKLMPGNPDARMNLALTLERATHVEDAIGTYRTALEVSPEHIPSIQALTRLQCKTARRDSGTRAALETIALRGDSPQWREWAQQRLVADRK